MRRALIIFIAVIAVMLVCPATAPSAKSPSRTFETPTINIVSPRHMGDPGYSGEEDDGDGDTAGLRDGTRTKFDGGPAGVQSASGIKAWWMYYLMFFRPWM